MKNNWSPLDPPGWLNSNFHTLCWVWIKNVDFKVVPVVWTVFLQLWALQLGIGENRRRRRKHSTWSHLDSRAELFVSKIEHSSRCPEKSLARLYDVMTLYQRLLTFRTHPESAGLCFRDVSWCQQTMIFSPNERLESCRTSDRSDAVDSRDTLKGWTMSAITRFPWFTFSAFVIPHNLNLIPLPVLGSVKPSALNSSTDVLPSMQSACCSWASFSLAHLWAFRLLRTLILI